MTGCEHGLLDATHKAAAGPGKRKIGSPFYDATFVKP